MQPPHARIAGSSCALGASALAPGCKERNGIQPRARGRAGAAPSAVRAGRALGTARRNPRGNPALHIARTAQGQRDRQASPRAGLSPIRARGSAPHPSDQPPRWGEIAPGELPSARRMVTQSNCPKGRRLSRASGHRGKQLTGRGVGREVMLGNSENDAVKSMASRTRQRALCDFRY